MSSWILIAVVCTVCTVCVAAVPPDCVFSLNMPPRSQPSVVSIKLKLGNPPTVSEASFKSASLSRIRQC